VLARLYQTAQYMYTLLGGLEMTAPDKAKELQVNRHVLNRKNRCLKTETDPLQGGSKVMNPKGGVAPVGGGGVKLFSQSLVLKMTGGN